MESFSYISAAIMLIVGLGITHLLGDMVDAFRSRQTYRMQWIPMTWAVIVFAWQIQFLWAILELHQIQIAWSAVEFGILLALAMLLFIAGALVVPSAEDDAINAYEQFHQDGRWTLVVLSLFFYLAYFANIILFKEDWLYVGNLEDLLLATYLLVTVFRKRKKTWAMTTIIFAIASIAAMIELTPTAYS